MHKLVSAVAFAAASVAISGCVVSESERDRSADTGHGAGGETSPAVTPPAPAMRIEVDLAARRLYVIEGGARTATHPVAVGSEKWPTRTGEWAISQVVFNPEWVPPDESWAEEREPRKPGDPRNPLGRVQFVYDPPRSIHGTNQPSSMGKAVSHGSIRVTNEVGLQLARKVLEAGGAPKDDAWIRGTQENRTEKQIVDLPRPIPIRVF